MTGTAHHCDELAAAPLAWARSRPQARLALAPGSDRAAWFAALLLKCNLVLTGRLLGSTAARAAAEEVAAWLAARPVMPMGMISATSRPAALLLGPQPQADCAVLAGARGQFWVGPIRAQQPVATILPGRGRLFDAGRRLAAAPARWAANEHAWHAGRLVEDTECAAARRLLAATWTRRGCRVCGWTILAPSPVGSETASTNITAGSTIPASLDSAGGARSDGGWAAVPAGAPATASIASRPGAVVSPTAVPGARAGRSRICVDCGAVFEAPRRGGRPPIRCLECRRERGGSSTAGIATTAEIETTAARLTEVDDKPNDPARGGDVDWPDDLWALGLDRGGPGAGDTGRWRRVVDAERAPWVPLIRRSLADAADAYLRSTSRGGGATSFAEVARALEAVDAQLARRTRERQAAWAWDRPMPDVETCWVEADAALAQAVAAERTGNRPRLADILGQVRGWLAAIRAGLSVTGPVVTGPGEVAVGQIRGWLAGISTSSSGMGPALAVRNEEVA